MRFIEEFEKANIPYHIAYIDSFTITYVDGEINITFGGKNLKEFTHVIFGGHNSDSEWDYRIKVITAEYTKKYNQENPDSQIKLQNQEFILNMPYYDKLHMALISMQHNLPHLNTYYRNDGAYEANEDFSGGYPIIAKHALGLNERIEKNGKRLLKKNVFLIENPEGWHQDRLDTKDKKEFFTQQYSKAGEDYRIFVSKGKVVGGWKRISLDDSFMTVGGKRRYELYNTPAPEIVDVCEKAAKAWGADFMALDFIYKEEQPVILEFSMHPGFNAYENKCEAGNEETSKEPINVPKVTIESF